jgi:predicted nucleic acid-binding protein
VIVIDSSIVLEVLLRMPSAAALDKRLFVPGEVLHAPHLIDLEVAQVLRRYTLAGHITSEDGRIALEDFSDFPIRRLPHRILLPRVWELRHNMTAYDAAYVALAEALGAPLLTCDGRLAASPGHDARIELF